MEYLAPPIKNETSTSGRIKHFISDIYFKDYNLRGKLFEDQVDIGHIKHVNFGQNRVSFQEARAAFSDSTRVENVSQGFSFGPTWSTHWFSFEVKLPENFVSNEKRVHVLWDSDCEASIWTEDGQIKGILSPEVSRTDFVIPKNYQGVYYIEASSNKTFGAGKETMIGPPNPDRQFTLKTAKFVIFRDDVYQLLVDFEVANDLIKNLAEEDHFRFETMYLANHVINTLIKNEFSPESILKAHESFSRHLKHSSPCFEENETARRTFWLHAIGNCHIDTAWLWPYDETKRKCARSWSQTIELMRDYPDLNFAVSQAQQLQWVKESYPGLFDKIKEKVAEGRITPVGGTWVEMDGNLPGAESMVRQMLYGQAFFRENFGRLCDIFWLPDTFGYSPQLPQIIMQSGMRFFLTQKLSWNLVNKFPHTTFWWRGLDGTKILTHFPPADTYNANVTAEEIIKSLKNFKDKGRSRHGILLYGFGDGGGGPERGMLERMKRLQTAINPVVLKPSTPQDFFEQLQIEDQENVAKGSNLCSWDGELYLELHNGTYTTHADMKKLNRKMEFLLRDCEFVTVCKFLANLSRNEEIPLNNWASAWKKVLLNQFHDVLPGTSIEAVYDDARRLYSEVEHECYTFLKNDEKSATNPYVVNSLNWMRRFEYQGDSYTVPPLGIYRLDKCQKSDQTMAGCEVKQEGNRFLMTNMLVSAEIDGKGHLRQLVTENLGLNPDNVLDELQPSNAFVIFDDVPLYWDAWDVMDYHMETRKILLECCSAPKITLNRPNKVCVEFSKRIGEKSLLTQTISLSAGEPFLRFETKVDWQESHKMLKVEFATNFSPTTSVATYETQFGHIRRPTHRNTSWDWAKFEVCAQKWADLSELERGLSIVNDGKYGYSCSANVMSLSLLRSPKNPDPTCDMGVHEFQYTLFPHTGSFQRPSQPWNVQFCAYELNSPIRFISAPDLPNEPLDEKRKGLFHIGAPNNGIFIETVKMAESSFNKDKTGSSVVVRLYESFGAKTDGVKFFGACRKPVKVELCNFLEEKQEELSIGNDDQWFVVMNFRAFEVKSLKLTY